MQQRHLDRYTYFRELAATSRDFYIDYLSKKMEISSQTRILEIGCGEGGNLLPFAEKGCEVIGIDIARIRIEQAREFFSKEGCKGTFICSDILKMNEDIGKFDVIIIHDVIEHIPKAMKLAFMMKTKSLLKGNGLVFWGFPAWQMPFGGHQQIARNKVLSHFPYVHLLPSFLYKAVISLAREDVSCQKELLSIKQCGVSIESFEQMLRETNHKVEDRVFWFINPHYQQKFNMTPRRLSAIVGVVPYLRNFVCSSCFYLTR